MDYELFQIADAIRIFKGLTITEVASETKINRGNLNAWLKSGSPDRLSADKIKKIFDYLEIDLDPLRLRPGIHRFTITPRPFNEAALIEPVIFKFFPEGGTFYTVWEKKQTEVSFLGSRWTRWVAVPKLAHDIKVIFKIGEKTKYTYRHFLNYHGSVYKSLSELFMSGVCGWHVAESRILLPDRVFARVSSDESLTVSELDKILFNPPSSDYLWTGDSIAAEDQPETEYDSQWTWDRLVSALKAQGKVPEEVARREGLLDHENK
jgi:transcriptional regulator with XRE-family HTH domain